MALFDSSIIFDLRLHCLVNIIKLFIKNLLHKSFHVEPFNLFQIFNNVDKQHMASCSQFSKKHVSIVYKGDYTKKRSFTYLKMTQSSHDALCNSQKFTTCFDGIGF
jgi:hypothetical protein